MTYETHQSTPQTTAAKYDTTQRQDITHRQTGSALTEIFGLGAVALIAMGLLTFGYNMRSDDAATTAAGEPMSIQAQTPATQDRVSPNNTIPPPASSTTGQGDSNGEKVAPAPTQQ